MATYTTKKKLNTALWTEYISMLKGIKKKGSIKEQLEALKHSAPILQTSVIPVGDKESSVDGKKLHKEVMNITKSVKDRKK